MDTPIVILNYKTYLESSGLNALELAYIGDAYYELRVRKHLLEKGITKNKDLMKISINYDILKLV